MKKLTTLLLTAGILLLNSCIGDDKVSASTDQKQAQATEQSLAEANRQVGMPAIKNFQQRKLMKLIYELCDREDLVCFAYLQNEYTGRLVYIGKCMGYGIPFSAQFTNPQRLVDVTDFGIQSYHSNDSAVIPQADPNGLFMPTSSSATWLMMIDPESGEPRPVYFEPTIVVSPFELNGE